MGRVGTTTEPGHRPWPDAARALAARAVRGIGLSVAAAELLTWPTDAALLAGLPHEPWQARARALGLGYGLLVVAVAWVPALRPALLPAFSAASLLVAAAVAWCFGHIGGLDTMFFYVAYALIPASSVVVGGTAWRAAFNLGLGVAWVGGFALADPAALTGPSAAPAIFFLAFVLLFSTLAGTGITRLLRRDHARQAELDEARARAWGLLSEMLPAELAAQLAESPGTVARAHPQVTVLFADLMGFTEMSAQISPQALVGLLDEVFGAFDALCTRHGVEKIKTIGDAYMAAGGLQDGDRGAAARVAALALEMQGEVGRIRRPDGAPLVLRVGVATGPVVAGVLGRRKYSYDLWGDTVNLASRLEGSALPGTVQLCARTVEALGPGWAVISRGAVELKGIGEVPGFFLVGPARPAGPGPADVPV